MLYKNSLCILDELGRGTATFDGTAIAHAVVDYLVKKIRCRTLFATHYHSLIDDWEIDPRVKLGHMDCFVQGEAESSQSVFMSTTNDAATDDLQEDSKEVTFLYKLCDGSSPRSYGINVAKLAGLPPQVISLALKQSREFEEKMKANVIDQNNIESKFYA
jgi:DNA mismatch repair protein MSH6